MSSIIKERDLTPEYIKLLHKQIDTLKNLLEERDVTIKKLRIELERLNYKKANQGWVE